MAEENKEYYLATIDDKDGFIIYDSEAYKLTEIDIINLIKVCVIERRNLRIGNKILDAYRDSTEHRKDITEKRLQLIGVKKENNEPTTAIKPRHR